MKTLHRLSFAALAGLAFFGGTPRQCLGAYYGGDTFRQFEIVPIYFGHWTAAEMATKQAKLQKITSFLQGSFNPAGMETIFAQYARNATFLLSPLTAPIVDPGSARTLTVTEELAAIHQYQNINGIPYSRDKAFLLLLSSGYLSSANCGWHANEGQGAYFGVSPNSCDSLTDAHEIFETLANPGATSWPEIVDDCEGLPAWTLSDGTTLPPTWDSVRNTCPAQPFVPQTSSLPQIFGISSGSLWRSTQPRGGGWTPFAPTPAPPMPLADVDVTQVNGSYTHVAAVTTSGRIFHTIATEDFGWSPWIDVSASTGANALTFTKASATSINGDLHVCALTNTGRIFHGTRHATLRSGESWDPLAEVPTNIVGINDVDCGAVGDVLHVVYSVNTGGDTGTIKRISASAQTSWSTWSATEDVGSIAGTFIGMPTSLSVSPSPTGLSLVVATGTGSQYYSAWNGTTWTWFNRLTSPSGSFVLPAISGASTVSSGGQIELVSVSTTGSVFHMRKYADGSWVAPDSVSRSNTGGPQSFGALSATIAPSVVLPDLLWRHGGSGQHQIWHMQNNSLARASYETISGLPADGTFQTYAVADFDANGTSDLLQHDPYSGQTRILYLKNGSFLSSAAFTGDIASVTGSWMIIGTADWDRDSKPDIAWYNFATGQIQIWLMNGIARKAFWNVDVLVSDPTNFVVFPGDFDGDGIPDFLLHNFGTGFNQVWFIANGGHRTGYGSLTDPSVDLGTVTNSQYELRAVNDFDSDGKPDLLWRKSGTGNLQVWFMNGTVRHHHGDVSDPALAVPYSSGWTLVTAYYS